MGRPRKDADTLDAKERIYQAFWDLLEDYHFHEITVGMIASKAQCNRGTFYYHFADINELTEKSINRELFANGLVSRIVIRIICGDVSVPRDIESIIPNIKRIQILAERGGGTIIMKKIKMTVLRVWETVLGVEEKDLEPTTRLIIEYAISGILGVLSYSSDNVVHLDKIAKNDTWLPFVKANAHTLYHSICAAQNISPQEAEARLKALVRFLELSNYSLDSLSSADTKLLRRLLSF
ncbi:MAG: TetR/AcrR family transcriptional regulator [Anaerotardibacter sp.]